MKTLLSIMLVALVTVTASAQEKGKRMHSNFSPEQMAEIQTKKMALYLDLNEGQQRDILKLNRERVEKRRQKIEKYKALKEKGEKLSDEERFNYINAQLDERLALQQKMKKILSAEQYQQWRKMGAGMHQKRKAMRSRMHSRRSW